MREEACAYRPPVRIEGAGPFPGRPDPGGAGRPAVGAAAAIYKTKVEGALPVVAFRDLPKGIFGRLVTQLRLATSAPCNSLASQVIRPGGRQY